jgi:hypothetical protein
VPLVVLCGMAASIIAKQGPQTAEHTPLAKAERVLPVLLLNIAFSSIT